VPIFEVGQTLGDVKEAVSNREKARLTWEETKRLALLDAENAREELVFSERSEVVLAEADHAAKENYEILQNEYRSNLVSNLDVRDALRRFQDIEKRYQEARYGVKMNYWKLRVALGDVPGIQE
jgi:outer membrane protein TolC